MELGDLILYRKILLSERQILLLQHERLLLFLFLLFVTEDEHTTYRRHRTHKDR